jgi:hypothetical protein
MEFVVDSRSFRLAPLIQPNTHHKKSMTRSIMPGLDDAALELLFQPVF